MKAVTGWSYTPYKPPLYEVGDVYISRLAPAETSIHVEWLGEAGIDYDIFDYIPVEYKCPCSKEKYEGALLSLGISDLEELSEDPKGIETVCHFCNSKYNFSSDEIKGMVAYLKSKPADEQ